MLPFRAIVCVDADSFEVQVWLKQLYQHYLDQDIPIVIVNPDNVVLSFNYSARATNKYGISRAMSKVKLSEIQRRHPELRVLSTGTRYGRCDTFTPFKESDIIMNCVVQEVSHYKGVLVERASRDEFFIDVTEALGERWDGNVGASNPRFFNARKRYPCKEHNGKPSSILYSGAAATCAYYTGQDILNRIGEVSDEEALIIQAGMFSEWLLDEIYKKTGYYCSAGVGPNKLIAKVASDLNKPAGVTMLTTSGFIKQTSSLPYDKLPGLKRNIGAGMRNFYEQEMRRQLKFVDQIQDLSFDQVCKFYHGKGEKYPAKKAKTLCDHVRGIDSDPVQHKLHDSCVGFSYTFRGTHTAKERDVKDIAKDMAERLGYIDEHQKRLPEYLLLRIEYKTRDSAGEIKNVLRANHDEQKDPRVLQDFIHDARIKNDIDLEIVKVFQFRAMNLKSFT